MAYSNYGERDSQIVDAGDTGFNKLNQRLRPDQLSPGEVSVSINGRMDIDGSWQPRRGLEKFGEPLTANVGALTVPFYIYTVRNITLADRVADVVTVTTSVSHGFTTATLVAIAGLTGSVNANGNRYITVTGAATFTFEIDGAVGNETYGGTGTAGSPVLTTTAVTGVYASCLFSDPSDDNAEYIILADNTEATAVSLADGTGTTITYPAGVVVSAESFLLQAFNKVFLFTAGVTTMEWDGDLSGSPAFTRAANGVFTQPVYLNAASNTVIADGVATVTEAAHGLSVGTPVFVVDNGSTALVEGFGGEYSVATVPGSGSFTVNVQVPDSTATAVVWSRRVSSGQGFTHLPAPAWGVCHQRRLWVPYAYEMAGSSGASPTITDRAIRDELLASDILDSDTLDRIDNQFKINGGTADYLVGVAPFAEDNLLVFNRNSLHLIQGVSGSLSDIQVRLVTDEIGCLARRTIVQVGSNVLFLSDNGVYSANFGDLYNLRGSGLPMSASIDPLIKRINPDHAAKSVAVYHDNRYYLACPLDGSTRNNVILVYNFLNQGWESLDTVCTTQWDIANLIVGGAGDVNKLYAVSSNGGIHIIDGRVDDVDRLSLYPGVAPIPFRIEAEFVSRQYTMKTMERKTFTSFDLHIESSESNASDADIGIVVENPDYESDLTTINELLGDALAVGEDASLRGRIGNERGYGLSISITPTAGRPKVRALKISATVTNFAQSQAT